MPGERIAIIGMGCRFPKASNPEAFWELLRGGADAITEVPRSRWDVDAFYHPVPRTSGKMCTRSGGFLEDVDGFDPRFFRIMPIEAGRIDPQHRLVLEVAWEALEDAGIDASSLAYSATGVFIGVSQSDHERLLYRDLSRIDGYNGPNTRHCFAANRLSYFLNLRGPSMAVDTACSSALVAAHLACQSLRSGECDLALVGGVNLNLSPEEFIALSFLGVLSADGRCKTFDDRADGYGRGEGCGIIVLKRLSDALKAGDAVRGVIRGSAVNQDGLSNGITSPNGAAQEEVLRQALRDAAVDPAHVSHIETMGTGTALGDPIEVAALKAVYGHRAQPCWLGSVKTNIGHLEAASGAASLVKIVLALEHRQIPPHLHLERLNPRITLDGTPFVIPVRNETWLSPTPRRLAAVSAFGFGGTNAHMIVEEEPPVEPPRSAVDRPLHVLTLSARDPGALRDLARRYVAFLRGHSGLSLADVCFTANAGRMHFDQRLAVVTATTTEVCERLEAFARGEAVPGLLQGKVGRGGPKLTFIFPARPREDMAHQLYATQPTFREAFDACVTALPPEVWRPPGSPGRPGARAVDANGLLRAFALEYAVAMVWKSWGLEPVAVVGDGVGEYVAACVAGVFTAPDAVRLLANHPLRETTPRAGPVSPPRELEVVFSTPRLDILGRTGWLSAGDVTAPAYWSRVSSRSLDVAVAARSLSERKIDLLMAAGASGLGSSDGAMPIAPVHCVSGLGRTGEEDWSALLHSVATAYTHGVSVNWSAFDRPYPRRRLHLPTYPFQRQPCRSS